MHCTVHCLVSAEDELQPLMERIAAAGIANDAVQIVWRPPAESAAAQVSRAAMSAWGVFLVPAVWWWFLGNAAWFAGGAAEVPGYRPPQRRRALAGRRPRFALLSRD